LGQGDSQPDTDGSQTNGQEWLLYYDRSC
jgi:hypothetical protein